jgi:phosphate transporter
LAQGGILIGKAIENTGLLHLIATQLTALTAKMSLFQVFLHFSAFTLIAASMISHTVAALIVLPMIKAIGMEMEENHSKLLVMGIGLICSAAMALPISGFPNMHAINVEDPNTGIRYLTTKDFIKVGVPSSIISMIVIVTVGYGLMEILHF